MVECLKNSSLVYIVVYILKIDSFYMHCSKIL